MSRRSSIENAPHPPKLSPPQDPSSNSPRRASSIIIVILIRLPNFCYYPSLTTYPKSHILYILPQRTISLLFFLKEMINRLSTTTFSKYMHYLFKRVFKTIRYSIILNTHNIYQYMNSKPSTYHDRNDNAQNLFKLENNSFFFFSLII